MLAQEYDESPWTTEEQDALAWDTGKPVGWEDTGATLPAAYAEASDFENAVKYGEKALSLASSDQRAVAGARLKAYRAGQPWREKSCP